MLKFILFILSFYILLFSVIGYGIFFQKIFFNNNVNLKEHQNIFIGFYGLFLITFLSIISSLVMPANFAHNIVLHFFRILFFFF